MPTNTWRRLANCSEEDAALFRAAAGEVTQLPQQNRVLHPRSAPHAIVRGTKLNHPVADILSDRPDNTAPDYLGNGLSHATLRKLKRGSYPAQAYLDLHGYGIDEARSLLQQFLFETQQQSLRCVVVIHGKGINSPGGESVLRALTRNWLRQHPEVLAFCPDQSGESGAVKVLLKIRP